MSDLNQCQFIGRLGKDPEIKYMPNGNAVANFSIATSEKWKDQQGQPQERTTWINLVAYKRLAEIIGEYVRKGSQIYVSGRLSVRKWQDQQGQDRYTTEVIVNQMQMLSSQQSGQQGNNQNQRPNQQQQSQQKPMNEPDFDFDDETIPF